MRCLTAPQQKPTKASYTPLLRHIKCWLVVWRECVNISSNVSSCVVLSQCLFLSLPPPSLPLLCGSQAVVMKRCSLRRLINMFLFFSLSEEKTQLVLNVDKQLEEVRELLEQMDLEVREIPAQSRAMYNSRLKSYKQEVEKLEKDFKRSRIAYSDEVRNELLGDDAISTESQLIKLREERAHLLDNTEKLERSSRRLEAGYQIAVETEQVGQEILSNLHTDREKIQRARERLRETDANLGKSSRILTGMLRRIIQNRILVFVLGAVILLTVILAIYLNLRSH
uniref:Vesicle transport through interaction with t-SNAREs 1A n=1 Tax=Nothobranchius furzeri TaxID=105023 RepID=A0A8C6PS17_NOTFU